MQQGGKEGVRKRRSLEERVHQSARWRRRWGSVFGGAHRGEARSEQRAVAGDGGRRTVRVISGAVTYGVCKITGCVTKGADVRTQPGTAHPTVTILHLKDIETHPIPHRELLICVLSISAWIKWPYLYILISSVYTHDFSSCSSLFSYSFQH